ncbi:hypothetical protein MKW98_026920 [Papaver atlanticum]|uniref:Uncharacterized protein n=1 Tax=Papaver atlanticum TaxID=357466 RepID=A0AAD4SWL2_9MAGN|nr:hypothetical protein MKW98_026920 [Papaver atlanticum]
MNEVSSDISIKILVPVHDVFEMESLRYELPNKLKLDVNYSLSNRFDWTPYQNGKLLKFFLSGHGRYRVCSRTKPIPLPKGS